MIRLQWAYTPDFCEFVRDSSHRPEPVIGAKRGRLRYLCADFYPPSRRFRRFCSPLTRGQTGSRYHRRTNALRNVKLSVASPLHFKP